jgi:hypothetical protein
LSDITITRTNIALPTNEELEPVRKLLFECIKGTTERENKAWRRWWKRVINFDAGEISFLKFIIPRNGKFHRKFMALLNVGFEMWEPKRKRKSYKGMAIEKNFDQFREDITILAGFYEQTFNIKGEMRLRAKSISFAAMEDDEFETLYQAVVTVLLREVCTRYAGRDELDAVVNRVMEFA